MDDPIILLLTGVVGLAAGVLIGALVASLFLGGKETKPAPPPQRPAAPPPPIQSGPPGYQEVLRLWQDSAGNFLPELHTERITDPARLTGAQRKALTQAMVTLYKWMGAAPAQGSSAQAAPITQAPALQPASPSQEPVASEAPLPTLPPLKLESSFADTLPQEPTMRDALSANPFKLRKQLQGKAPIAAPKSIVAMINDILQSQIAATPLAGRGVELREKPDGSMVIWTGTSSFTHVEDVTDPAVKAAIQSAVATFNRQNRPPR